MEQLPTTNAKYKSIHLGDGVWHIGHIDEDEDLCTTDSAEKAQVICNLLNMVDELLTSLKNVVDATEDKNGQFRAWHQRLRQSTKEAQELLNRAN